MSYDQVMYNMNVFLPSANGKQQALKKDLAQKRHWSERALRQDQPLGDVRLGGQGRKISASFDFEHRLPTANTQLPSYTL